MRLATFTLLLPLGSLANFPSMRLRFLLLLPLLALVGCGEYASVSDRKPIFQPIRTTVGVLSGIEQKIIETNRAASKSPLERLGEYLSVADLASRELKINPKNEAALQSYNFAIARVFSTLEDGSIDPWSQPITVPTDDGNYILDYRSDGRSELWNPKLYNLIPADELEVKGKYVENHQHKPGLGAPLVAIGKQVNKNAREDFVVDRTYYGVTGLVTFNGKNCEIKLEDPLGSENVVMNGRSYSLAADFTTPLAVMLKETSPKDLELSRLLQPEKYASTARISRLQPYNPKKKVLLCIHGLKDSPATWAPMINYLRGDSFVREHYQIWFFSYPSGYPYPYSASILRDELDKVNKKYHCDDMVIVGHSMGGCISRLLITDTNEELWIRYFGKSPELTNFSPSTKRILMNSLIFEHRQEIGRVIFISAPLKGSDLASGTIGKIGSWLIRAPITLLQVGNEAVQATLTGGDSLKIERMPNSVDTLAPDNRFVQEINQIPLTEGIPYHTIMGDRGKGGNHDRTSPVQSDGVVPYWSSHMEGARSELVVPSNHSAHKNPEAMAEVKRILKVHIRR